MEAPNDTAYKQWNYHRRLKAAVQIMSNLPTPSNGGLIYRFGHASHFGPAGWLALLLTKAGEVETNPGPTTLNKQVCNIHTHDTHHLLNCTHIRTTLSPLDL